MKKYNLANETIADVLNHIPEGRKKAIKHDKLRKVTGLNDRMLRRAIEQLRAEYCIINNQDGKGYYRATTQAEAERYLRQEKARIKSLNKSLKGTRNFLKKLEGQTELDLRS